MPRPDERDSNQFVGIDFILGPAARLLEIITYEVENALAWFCVSAAASFFGICREDASLVTVQAEVIGVRPPFPGTRPGSGASQRS